MKKRHNKNHESSLCIELILRNCCWHFQSSTAFFILCFLETDFFDCHKLTFQKGHVLKQNPEINS